MAGVTTKMSIKSIQLKLNCFNKTKVTSMYLYKLNRKFLLQFPQWHGYGMTLWACAVSIIRN